MQALFGESFQNYPSAKPQTAEKSRKSLKPMLSLFLYSCSGQEPCKIRFSGQGIHLHRSGALETDSGPISCRLSCLACDRYLASGPGLVFGLPGRRPVPGFRSQSDFSGCLAGDWYPAGFADTFSGHIFVHAFHFGGRPEKNFKNARSVFVLTLSGSSFQGGSQHAGS